MAIPPSFRTTKLTSLPATPPLAQSWGTPNTPPAQYMVHPYEHTSVSGESAGEQTNRKTPDYIVQPPATYYIHPNIYYCNNQQSKHMVFFWLPQKRLLTNLRKKKRAYSSLSRWKRKRESRGIHAINKRKKQKSMVKTKTKNITVTQGVSY